jgi:L-cystine transport system permease protein
MSFDLSTMIHSLQVASQYIGTTLFMAIISLMIGMILGLGIALIRLYKVKVISPILQTIITL